MKPYVPEKLPLANLDWGALVPLIGKANAELARYDGGLRNSPNPGILLAPFLTQEAVSSSRIEGSQVTMAGVLEFEELGDAEGSRDDFQEALNYRLALELGQGWLNERPLTLSLIKQIHSTLLNSARGKGKSPGTFREQQNWIGTLGGSIEDASFVPPEPVVMLSALDNLEAYLNTADRDPLVQAAIIHAQFELIHPFEDGNGRAGRILVPLFLYKQDIIFSPMFYISGYLETHRDRYIAKLRGISEHQGWREWVEFFLTAVIDQAKSNFEQTMAILSFYEEMKTTVSQITRSQYAGQALDALFQKTIFTSSGFYHRSGIPTASAKRILSLLESNGIIRRMQPGKGSRPALYGFPSLFRLVESIDTPKFA